MISPTPKVKPPKQPQRNTKPPRDWKIIDGIAFDSAWPDVTCILGLFRFAPQLEQDPFSWPFPQDDPKRSYTGTGRYQHFRQFCQLAFPHTFEFQDWSARATEDFCSNEQTAICGCTTSSKSTSAGLYGLTFYLCNTAQTAVIIVSNTIKGAKMRIWKSVSAYFSEFVRKTGYNESRMLGSPVPSICPLLANSQRDEGHGIHIIGVGEGDLETQINKVKGFHAKRILLIGDETDSITQAVPDSRANLRSGTKEFQCIWLGNRPSMFNPLGKLMEPSPGKPVTVSHKSWLSTTGVKCLRFDAWDSPNLRDNNKWTGIVRQCDIDSAVRDAGSPNAPIIWIMYRGLEPPEGADNTICSEAMISRFRCRDKVKWHSSFITSAMLDPGFGGDPCIYRTFKRGLSLNLEETDHSLLKLRVMLDEVIQIPINADDPNNPAEYQIARKVQELNQSRSIPPDEFVIASTGTGRGAAAVLKREYSQLIHTCEEGGAPSDSITSDQDPTPAKERYDRRITELCFSIKLFIEADMIRGLDEKTAAQLCSRLHDLKGRKISVEKKEDMKSRGIPSPNEMDALAAGIDLLRQEKQINAAIVTTTTQAATQSFEKAARELDFDSDENSYSDSYALESEDAMF
jgi:hypothetical protein